MLISMKQQEANRENAQHSTGPKTPEGKAAVRMNALTWGLRAKSFLVTGEKPEEYQRLWDTFADEWQPQSATEYYQLETMVGSIWLQDRNNRNEDFILNSKRSFKDEQYLTEQVSRRRARLERSFNTATRELKQLQKDRKSKEAAATAAKRSEPKTEQNPGPRPPAPDPGEQSEPPAYVMSPATP
jgi:hypothetical protein